MAESRIETELKSRLRAAMKARSREEMAVIRNIMARIDEARTAPGFSGDVDDALYLQVIASYVKSMAKARDEVAAQEPCERGAAMIAGLDYEIRYLSVFMPKKLDEAQTRALVRQVVADTGASGPKQIGRVMGVIMKSHRDEVLPGLLRELIEEELGQ